MFATRLKPLTDYLRTCLVRVEGREHGSGFFVGPGIVVTAAHVAGVEPDARVVVVWRDEEFPATISAASPPSGRGPFPYPDLAVLTLDRPPEHPCVWIDGRQPLPDTAFTIAGFAGLLSDGSAANTMYVQVRRLRHGGNDGPFIHLAGGEVSPGMSGGAVLNEATGGVCAVIKATRMLDSDMGGFASPIKGLRLLDPAVYVRLLRAHDRFHSGDSRWSRLAQALIAGESDGTVPLDEEVRLRGVLASARTIIGHEGHFVAAAGDLVVPPDHPMHDYADVLNELGEMQVPQRGLPPLLAYLCDRARDLGGDGGLEVRDWVNVTAGRLDRAADVRERLRATRSEARPVSLMARIRRTANDSTRFRLTVWRYLDPHNVVPIIEETDPEPIADAWRRLHQAIPPAVHELERHHMPVRVELFLPLELLDEPAERWSLWDDEGARLGLRCAVLVRDADRLDNDDVVPPWEHRWAAARGRPVPDLLDRIECEQSTNHEAVYGWLRGQPLHTLLVLSGSPVRGTARPVAGAALRQGVPVLFWRREGCGGCPVREQCTAGEFDADLADALGNATVDDLPERVWKLRCDHAGREAHHWTRGLVLLWDDPRRRPPNDPLRTPARVGTHG